MDTAGRGVEKVILAYVIAYLREVDWPCTDAASMSGHCTSFVNKAGVRGLILWEATRYTTNRDQAFGVVHAARKRPVLFITLVSPNVSTPKHILTLTSHPCSNVCLYITINR